MNEELYDKTYNQFIDLIENRIDKVVITKSEMLDLDYVLFSKKVICDNNGNYVCDYINGKYNNYADILRKLAQKHNIIQIEDVANDCYIFTRQ